MTGYRYKKLKLTTGICLALSALGRNLICNGNKSEEAKSYYKESMGAVDHLRSTTQLPVWDDLHAVILDANNQLHTMMEPAVFEKAWNEDVAMTLDGMVM